MTRVQTGGWVRLWRGIQNTALWTEPRRFSRLECFLDILLSARYGAEASRELVGNRILECRQGECLRSTATWAARWGMARAGAYRALRLLVRLGLIEVSDEGTTTRVRVRRYARLYGGLAPGQPAPKPRNADQRHSAVRTDRTRSLDVPPTIDTPDLRTAWAEFRGFCAQAGKPLTPTRERLCLERLVELSCGQPAVALQLVRLALEKGWTSVYPPRGEQPAHGPTRNRADGDGWDAAAVVVNVGGNRECA
jgi:hypothetical protein